MRGVGVRAQITGMDNIFESVLYSQSQHQTPGISTRQGVKLKY